MRLQLVLLLFAFVVTKHKAQETYTLQQVLKLAKQNNPTLISEKYEVDIAKSDLITAKLYSNFNFNYEYLHLSDTKDFSPDTR